VQSASFNFATRHIHRALIYCNYLVTLRCSVSCVRWKSNKTPLGANAKQGREREREIEVNPPVCCRPARSWMRGISPSPPWGSLRDARPSNFAGCCHSISAAASVNERRTIAIRNPLTLRRLDNLIISSTSLFRSDVGMKNEANRYPDRPSVIAPSRFHLDME
jgi:hypothetical protein